MSGHDEYRQWSAAYVLGALDAAQRLEFEGHLADCPECQSEVQAFAPIPGLLTRVESLQPVPVPPRIEERVANRLRSEWSELMRSRRRWQVAAVAAGLAAVLALATLLSGADSPSGTPLVFAEDVLVSGEIMVEQRAWGTEVDLNLESLPPAESYEAWAVDGEGRWHQVAVWGPTPNLSASVTGASSVAVSEIERIVVTTEDREQVLVEALFVDG